MMLLVPLVFDNFDVTADDIPVNCRILFGLKKYAYLVQLIGMKIR